MLAAPPATQEELLVACVPELPARLARQQQPDSAASDWNVVYAAVGIFADVHLCNAAKMKQQTLPMAADQ